MIRYTIMEAKGFTDYERAGEACNLFETMQENPWTYTYKMIYVSKGIVVLVLEDGRLKGYLG